MNKKLICASSAVLALMIAATAAAKPPAGRGPRSVSHTAIQTTPIQLGTSGGWADDLANGYCCGGTLGSLVRLSDGSLHILSNFHVFAGDVIAGGNNKIATIGDSTLGLIIQPGLIDVGCNVGNAQFVAVLSGAADPLGTLQAGDQRVDAAIAQVIDGTVDPNGAILEIGKIANTTVSAALGLGVKKSGRTTGLTRSTIVGLDATIVVAYEDECAGANRGTATYAGQILVDNTGNSFLNGGDSGSLMVEDISSAPHAVGLLFAGSTFSAVANPIDDVLARFGAEMVGVDPSTVTDPGTGDTSGPGHGNGRGKPKNSQAIARARSVHANNATSLSGVGRSNGHGIGVDESGDVYIAVYVESLSDAPSNVPASIDGIPVRVVPIGHVVAY